MWCCAVPQCSSVPHVPYVPHTLLSPPPFIARFSFCSHFHPVLCPHRALCCASMALWPWFGTVHARCFVWDCVTKLSLPSASGRHRELRTRSGANQHPLRQEENRDKSGSSAQSTPSNPVHVCSRYIFAALAAVVCKPTRYIASASSFWWLESPILACLSDIRKTVTFQCHILPVSTVDEGCAWTRGRGERGRTWWTSCCGDVWQGQPCL